MERFKKFFLVLSIILAMVIPTLSIADVGDFESYDSDWGSSDWDSSDWSSSSDDYYSYGGTSSSDSNGAGVFIAFIIIMVIYI